MRIRSKQRQAWDLKHLLGESSLVGSQNELRDGQRYTQADEDGSKSKVVLSTVGGSVCSQWGFAQRDGSAGLRRIAVQGPRSFNFISRRIRKSKPSINLAPGFYFFRD